MNGSWSHDCKCCEETERGVNGKEGGVQSAEWSEKASTEIAFNLGLERSE